MYFFTLVTYVWFSAGYRTDALVCTTSDRREIPVSPSLVRSVSQKASERVPYEHPRSPSLLQKCELRTDSKSSLRYCIFQMVLNYLIKKTKTTILENLIEQLQRILVWTIQNKLVNLFAIYFFLQFLIEPTTKDIIL